MTELIEYLGSEELNSREMAFAWAVGITVGVGVALFFLLTIV